MKRIFFTTHCDHEPARAQCRAGVHPPQYCYPSSAVALLRRTDGGRVPPALHCGSWKASFRFCACIGTMNPPLTPPGRGTDRTRTDACSPPGRGRGWVGSWRGSTNGRLLAAGTLVVTIAFSAVAAGAGEESGFK